MCTTALEPDVASTGAEGVMLSNVAASVRILPAWMTLMNEDFAGAGPSSVGHASKRDCLSAAIVDVGVRVTA